MNKVFTSLMFVGAFVLTGTGFAQTPPPADTTTTTTTTAAPAAVAPAVVHHHDHYPELHRALRKLRGAKSDLEKAAHDYDGHRVKAIGMIDQAIAELQAALEYAKTEK